MRKLCPENERMKREYFIYLKEAQRASEAVVDKAASAIARFEDFTKGRDFKRFHIKQATAFKAHLAEQKTERSGRPLSMATVHQTLASLRTFFVWLAGKPGYRARMTYADADYFNLSEGNRRIATTSRESVAPTLEQVETVLSQMPEATALEKRDRALIAFAILTGARDGAIASAKLKHVNLRLERFRQDAREVNTKFSKSFDTTFFPVGGYPREIVTEWIDFLRRDQSWGDDDPLFPASKVAHVPTSKQFEVVGLDRKHWSGAAPIRRVFREAFERAGLPYFNPHSFRKTLALLGEQICRSPEEMKAWSQNLGHDSILTTLQSYGTIPAHRQAEIIAKLAQARPSDDAWAELQGFIDARRIATGNSIMTR
jgi:integrase